MPYLTGSPDHGIGFYDGLAFSCWQGQDLLMVTGEVAATQSLAAAHLV